MKCVPNKPVILSMMIKKGVLNTYNYMKRFTKNIHEVYYKA